ncbi:MAG: hypothetical protein IPL35_07110 [Sphingobacteriales bacterium]|nr:hypothetical protein [Sphingobacteriales bacterium]
MPLLLQEDGVSIEYYALQKHREPPSDNRTYIEKPEKFISVTKFFMRLVLELRAGVWTVICRSVCA